MPNLSMTVPEVNVSVLRPVIYDIVRQVQAITKIDENTKILYPGESEGTYQKGSVMGTLNERDNTSLSNDSRIDIEVEEKYNEGMILSTEVTRPEFLPLFHDDKIGVFIKPIYSKNDYVINFKYRTRSKTQGLRWRDDIRMRTSMARDINLHDVTYHFMLPYEFIEILKEIHTLRENVAGYGDDFATYMAAHASTKITRVANQSGKQSGLGVTEKQMRIQGIFGFDYAPEEGSKEGDVSTWTTTFTYTFSFSKPIGCNMRYPCMVHNQVLDNKYLLEDNAYNEDTHDKSWSISGSDNSFFERQNEIKRFKRDKKTLTLPAFDEFTALSVVHGTTAAFTALCGIGEDDKRLVLNLQELDTHNIDPEILRFFAAVEYPFLARPYKSIFHVSLYRSMGLMSHQDIVVDQGLNVRSLYDLDLRVNHRVRFSIVHDLTLLDPQSLVRLKQYPKVLDMVMRSIDIRYSQLVEVSGKVNLIKYFPDLPKTGPSLQSVRDATVQFNTVCSAFIIARDGRRGDSLDYYLKHGNT